MRLVNRRSSFIDYRPHRRPGVRVWKDRCRIIVRVGSDWAEVGPQLELPLEVPRSIDDFRPTEDVSNVVRVAAFRYELEEPESDLIEVLQKEKLFEQALQVA